MKTPKKQFRFNKKLLALSVLAACGSAHAEDEDVAKLVHPQSSVSVGLGAATGDTQDRAIFGQYNGLRENNSNLLLDVDVVKRDDTAGLWTIFKGRNLGLDTSELSFSQNKQGDWKYSVEYNELVRRDPRTINSDLVNPLTTTPTVVSLATPGTGQNLNLDIRRKAASLSAEKWITPNLMFEGSVKNEQRQGSRMFGTGIACSPYSSITCGTGSSVMGAAMLMLPEPINSTTKQFEASLNYSGEKYMLSGGYYGSFFSNSNGSINPTISGNLYNPDGTPLDTSVAPGSTLAGYLQQSVALPPDNQAHQFYISGNYAFTPTTRSTFKYAYTHAEQHDDFGSMGLTGAPAGVSNLGGVMDTTLAQFGVTARPMTKLSMLANLRYEDKADKTPLAYYNGAYTNGLNSSRKYTGKLEGSYQLPDNYRATLGVDYESMQHAHPVGSVMLPINPVTGSPSLSGLREETHELGYRAELRRSMSETLNAAVSLQHSNRGGQNWFSIAPGFPPVPDATIYNAVGAFPMTMMDRIRNKVKVSADWTPIEKLSLQFILENGEDTYSAPTTKGMRDTSMSSYGIDAALVMSEKWKLTGYVNQANQTIHVDYSTGYMADLEDINTSVGLGMVGKLSSKLEVGGDLSYTNDINRYDMSMATGAAIVGGLPDVTYRVTSLKLYGKYALQKNADIRVNLVNQNVQFDEWTWGANGIPFAYSDNITVSMQPNQNVTFLGASYIYKFR